MELKKLYAGSYLNYLHIQVHLVDRGKVGFIFAHSQHSHISAFNNSLIIYAIKLCLANSNQRQQEVR